MIGALANEHVEVVEPEIGKHLLQLPIAVNSAQQLGRLHFVVDDARRIVQCQHGFALLRRETGKQRLTLLKGNALR